MYDLFIIWIVLLLFIAIATIFSTRLYARFGKGNQTRRNRLHTLESMLFLEQRPALHPVAISQLLVFLNVPPWESTVSLHSQATALGAVRLLVHYFYSCEQCGSENTRFRVIFLSPSLKMFCYNHSLCHLAGMKPKVKQWTKGQGGSLRRLVLFFHSQSSYYYQWLHSGYLRHCINLRCCVGALSCWSTSFTCYGSIRNVAEGVFTCTPVWSSWQCVFLYLGFVDRIGLA